MTCSKAHNGPPMKLKAGIPDAEPGRKQFSIDQVDMYDFPPKALEPHIRCVSNRSRNWFEAIHLDTHVLVQCCFCRQDVILVEVGR